MFANLESVAWKPHKRREKFLLIAWERDRFFYLNKVLDLSYAASLSDVIYVNPN